MADDLELLTTPVAKGKSLMKKLRKDMSRESTNIEKRESRPYLYPTSTASQAAQALSMNEPLPLRVRQILNEEPLPFSEQNDDLLPHGSSRRRNRRNYRTSYEGDNVELAELRRPIKSSLTRDAGSMVQGVRSSQYGTIQGQDQSIRYSNINRKGVQTDLITRQENRLSSASTSRTVRWDDSVDSGQTATTHPDARTRLHVKGGRGHDGSERHSTTDPWTISQTGNTYFVYGTSLRAANPPKEHEGCCGWWDEMWADYGGFRRITSPWIFAALGLLLISNILFFTAFLTNSWGILHVVHVSPNPGSVAVANQPTVRYNDTSYSEWIWNAWNGIPNPVYILPEEELHQQILHNTMPQAENDLQRHVVNMMLDQTAQKEFWKFGLWECCRNIDGLCLGPRFTEFYAATRTLCVLSLFFGILSFSWMLGHTLEKLMDYDTCTMATLISMIYLTGLCTTLALLCFGIKWPVEFENEYEGTDPELAYSFYLAAISVPLTLGAAACATIDLQTGIAQIKEDDKFFSDPDNFPDQTMSDIPTDNISRPRNQKKKRTGPASYNYVYESQA